MVLASWNVDGYTPMPVVFHEDDHYPFAQEKNNMIAALKAYASWGYFDFRRSGEAFEEGFQTYRLTGALIRRVSGHFWKN